MFPVFFCAAHAWLGPHTGPPPRATPGLAPSARHPPAMSMADGPVASGSCSGSFMAEFQGFRFAVRHRAAAAGFEDEAPLLLVHPIGVGLASWFYAPFLDSWRGAEVFAPDFIGCGPAPPADPWRPSERGLFIPLDWVRQLEHLWCTRIRRPCVVVCQGGLAPVAIKLAARVTDEWDGAMAVCGLVLASPPTWDDMQEGLDEAEAGRNFRLLSSPLGAAGYSLLRSRASVELFRSACLSVHLRAKLLVFLYAKSLTPALRVARVLFSNLFLFSGAADESWLGECDACATADARWPVFAFNAGLVGCDPLREELRRLEQPVMVLSGADDGRAAKRSGYGAGMRRSRMQTLPTLNVLPWEAPEATADAVAEFCRAACGTGGGAAC